MQGVVQLSHHVAQLIGGRGRGVALPVLLPPTASPTPSWLRGLVLVAVAAAAAVVVVVGPVVGGAPVLGLQAVHDGSLPLQGRVDGQPLGDQPCEGLWIFE